MFWSTSTWILVYIWVGGFWQHHIGVNLVWSVLVYIRMGLHSLGIQPLSDWDGI